MKRGGARPEIHIRIPSPENGADSWLHHQIYKGNFTEIHKALNGNALCNNALNKKDSRGNTPIMLLLKLSRSLL